VTNRITRIAISLSCPYTFAGTTKVIPAGTYEVTTEEEPLGDMMESGYRRIAANLYVPPPGGRVGIGEIVDIGQSDLDALLKYTSAA